MNFLQEEMGPYPEKWRNNEKITKHFNESEKKIGFH
jgi:hypothetical protein